ncbi:unnamed protein product [Ilex paraguariensis]|uniref:GDT1 family protein n=1 Tax=Ilex paraguariensis TaxID=185542 RepID=A0ABC8UAI1_9AQUA
MEREMLLALRQSPWVFTSHGRGCKKSSLSTLLRTAVNQDVSLANYATFLGGVLVRFHIIKVTHCDVELLDAFLCILYAYSPWIAGSALVFLALGFRLQRATVTRQQTPMAGARPTYYNIWTREILDLEIPRNLVHGQITAQASNVGIGSEGYEGREDNVNQKILYNGPGSDSSSNIEKPPNQFPYPLSIAIVLFGCALLFSMIAFIKGGPSSILAAIAKSGFTAAFTLIFVSEIGDKTFFIAGLLAMQYRKGLFSDSVVIQTALPIGEYAAVTLLMFFGLKSIKDAWDLPSNVTKSGEKSSAELDEFVEAEELVKEKVSQRLSSPLEIVWKSFSLIFFAQIDSREARQQTLGKPLKSKLVLGLHVPPEAASLDSKCKDCVEWGDRSMLATIALGAAQSPWGVAGGAITGHLFATTIAILGGAFLANYISEKLVGYLGGVLFLVFAVATFVGVF